MNNENKKLIWSIIQKHGDNLKGRLKPHIHHPKGRNSYVHICMLIKQKFKSSYKDISDEKIEELKSFILEIND